MRPSYLLIAVTVGSAMAVLDFADVIKSWESATRQRVVSRLLNTDEYGKLNASFQQLLITGNLSSVTMSDMYTVPTSLWDKLGVGAIATLQKGVRDYVRRNKISARTKGELDVLLAANVSLAEAIDKLKTLLPKATPTSVDVQLLLEYLGDPTTWTKQNITDMKEILFYLPISMLTRIQNQSVISELYDEVVRCMGYMSGVKSSSCPSNIADAKGEGTGPRAQYMSSLNYWVFDQLYTTPSNWTIALFKLLNLNAIPPAMLTKLADNVFMSREDAILTTLQSNKFRRDVIGREVVKKILADAEVMKSSVSSVRQVLARLDAAYLYSHVYITDLPPSVLDADGGELRRNMEELSAIAVEGGSVDGEVVEEFAKQYSDRKNLSEDEVNRLGPALLALLPGTTLNATLEKQALGSNDMVKLSDAVRNTAGIGTKGKLLQIRDGVFSATNNDKFLNSQSKLPDELLGSLPLRYVTTPFTSALDVLRRNATFATALLVGLVSQLSKVSVKSLPPNALEAVDVSVLDDLSDSEVKALAKGMPASSKIGLVAAKRAFDSRVVSLSTMADMAAVLQAGDARKVGDFAVPSELEAIKDMFPTHGACKVLQKKLVKYIKWDLLAESEAEVASLLSPTDLVLTPPCVVAAFGPDLVRGLPHRQKLLLLGKLVVSKDKVLSTDSISRPMLEVIIEEGLKARRRLTKLMGSEVQELGGLLLYAPAPTIAAVSSEGSCVALRIFNALGSSVLMPCLDAPRRKAVGDLILKCLGEDAAEWTRVSDVCCLLHLLPLELLRQVPQGALVLCRCEPTDAPQHASWADAREMDCRSRLGGDYDQLLQQKENLLQLQAQAAFDLMDSEQKSRRRRRATRDVSMCNTASVSGVDDLSEAELRATAPAEVVACLAALGGRYMGDGKAQILLEKVLETLNPKVLSKLTNAHIRDMNYIMKGVKAGNIHELPSFVHPDFDDSVAVLGNEKMEFSQQQLEEYATKLVSTWRYPSSMNALDLAAFNRLTCALNASLINELSSNALRSVLGTFGRTLEGCDREKVLRPLALRAKSIYSMPFSRAEVQEMGVIMGGLPAADVAAVPSEAMGGLSPCAVRAMSSEAFAGLSEEQLRSLQSGTAQAVLQTHWGVLSPSQREAVSEVLMENSPAPPASTPTTMLLLAAILFLRHSLMSGHSVATPAPLTGV